jgi:hypothetical protein
MSNDRSALAEGSHEHNRPNVDWRGRRTARRGGFPRYALLGTPSVVSDTGPCQKLTVEGLIVLPHRELRLPARAYASPDDGPVCWMGERLLEALGRTRGAAHLDEHPGRAVVGQLLLCTLQ